MRDEITAMLPYQEYGYTFFERYNYYPVDAQIKCTAGHKEIESFVTVYSDYTPIDEKGAFNPEPSEGELDMDSVGEELGHVVTVIPTCLVMTSDLFEDNYNNNDNKVLFDGEYVDIEEAILKLEYESEDSLLHPCTESYSSINSAYAVAFGREDLVYDNSLNDVIKYKKSVNNISTLPYVYRVFDMLASYSNFDFDFDVENAEVDTTKDISELEKYNFTVLYSKDSEETEDVTETAKVESTTEPTKAETEQTTSQKTEKAEKSPTIVNIDLGDVNGDNSVNSSDAVIVLQDYSNSIITGETALDPDVADVNQDGEVDSIDAVEILKNFAFTIISFE
jgi:hypothetical protein